MPKSGKISSTRGAVQPGSGLGFSTTRKSIPLAALGLGAYRDASPAAASGAVQVGEGSCPLARPWLIYGGTNEPEQKIIDVFICKLRKKLSNASGGRDYIEAVWGRGYMLREPCDEDAAPIAAAV